MWPQSSSGVWKDQHFDARRSVLCEPASVFDVPADLCITSGDLCFYFFAPHRPHRVAERPSGVAAWDGLQAKPVGAEDEPVEVVQEQWGGNPGLYL